MGMRHLTEMNRPALLAGAGKEKTDVCLVDYSKCPVSDVCWLLDTDSGCDTRDNCIFDIS